MKDLQTLARGFLVLVEASLPPLASTAFEHVPAIAPATKWVYDASDRAVVPPSALQQALPPWPAGLRAAGTAWLELIVDEKGQVESATLTAPFYSPYDRLLLDAARTWRYRPASCGGQPVKFRRLLEVVAGPQSSPSPETDALHPAAR